MGTKGSVDAGIDRHDPLLREPLDPEARLYAVGDDSLAKGCQLRTCET